MPHPDEQIPVRPQKVEKAKALVRRLPLNRALENYVVDKAIESDRMMTDLRGGEPWLPHAKTE